MGIKTEEKFQFREYPFFEARGVFEDAKEFEVWKKFADALDRLTHEGKEAEWTFLIQTAPPFRLKIGAASENLDYSEGGAVRHVTPDRRITVDVRRALREKDLSLPRLEAEPLADGAALVVKYYEWHLKFAEQQFPRFFQSVFRAPAGRPLHSRSVMRFVVYPGCGTGSCGAHTDYGLVTFQSDTVEGFEARFVGNSYVRPDKQRATALVSYAGDLWEKCWPSEAQALWHQVDGTPGQRFSAIFFLQPEGGDEFLAEDGVWKAIPDDYLEHRKDAARVGSKPLKNIVAQHPSSRP